MKDPEILGVTVVRATWRTGLCTPALSTAVLTHKKALQCSEFLSDAGLGSETAHPKLLQAAVFFQEILRTENIFINVFTMRHEYSLKNMNETILNSSTYDGLEAPRKSSA
jgi:hypothetical protein